MNKKLEIVATKNKEIDKTLELLSMLLEKENKSGSSGFVAHLI